MHACIIVDVRRVIHIMLPHICILYLYILHMHISTLFAGSTTTTTTNHRINISIHNPARASLLPHRRAQNATSRVHACVRACASADNLYFCFVKVRSGRKFKLYVYTIYICFCVYTYQYAVCACVYMHFAIQCKIARGG